MLLLNWERIYKGLSIAGFGGFCFFALEVENDDMLRS